MSLFEEKLRLKKQSRRADSSLAVPRQEHSRKPKSYWAGGTAGQPILGAIESEGVSEVMVVVTRYSGGIKLGTGGLCRAYGGTARLCLQEAERDTRTPVLKLSVTAPVGSLGGVYHATSECQRLSEDFTEDGSVVLRIAVELAQVDEIRRRIQDVTKGSAEIVEGDKRPQDGHE